MKTNHTLENLFEFAAALGQQKNYDEILRLVAQQAASVLNAEISLILMVNPQTQQTVKTVMREGRPDDARKYRLAQNQVTGWLSRNNQSLRTADIKKDDRFAGVKFGETPIKSVIAALLKIEGMTLGSLVLLNKSGDGAFSEHDLRLLEKISVLAAPYLRNVQKLKHYFEPALPDDALLRKYRQAGLLGKSKAFLQLLHTIEAAAKCDVRVQLEGRSGTGKELIARAIHTFSARSRKPFVAVDCGAIPHHLLESELFGHLKGAFTGAMADRTGLLESANNGTFFMDEIANLPLDVQAKLMRFLQEGEIRPVGSNRTRRLNVRIISASSHSLQKLVSAEKFREDLFYRLQVYPVYVPPLADRRDDIPMLASHFLEKYAGQQNKSIRAFDGAVMQFLQRREWRGNIRELENFIERIATLAPTGAERSAANMLPSEFQKEIKKLDRVEDFEVTQSLSEQVAAVEAAMIRKALTEHGWNQSQAARALKVPLQTLRYKMQKLGIPFAT